MKTKQYLPVLATVMGVGLLFANANPLMAQADDHGANEAKDQGQKSDQHMMQQMHECMTTMREGMGEQHGMMQGMGEMTREQMMARMEACIERMEHSGGMGGMMGQGGSGADDDNGGRRHQHKKTDD